MGWAAAVEGAALVMVSVALTGEPPVMLTDEGRLQVGATTLFVVGEVSWQVRLTWPAKPPDGVTVMVEVLPVVAPGAMVRLPLFVSEKDGSDCTVNVVVVEAVMLALLSSVAVILRVYVPRDVEVEVPIGTNPPEAEFPEIVAKPGTQVGGLVGLAMEVLTEQVMFRLPM